VDVVLSAMDADVINTYVDLGIGVGVIASVAFDEVRDTHLAALDARHLFATNTTRVAIKRGAWLRGYVYDFIHTFAPSLTREVVERALATAPGEHPSDRRSGRSRRLEAGHARAQPAGARCSAGARAAWCIRTQQFDVEIAFIPVARIRCGCAAPR
jgi:hypothetical protein